MPFRHREHRRSTRGSILLVTVVLMALLLAVGVALVLRGSKANAGITAKQKYDAGLSCADGARQMLLGQFRAFNVSIASLTLNATVNNQTMTSGHYDNFNVQSVKALSNQQYANSNVEGLANRNISTPLGGAPYQFTVVCDDTTGQARQTEVEFFIRFGI